uniref:Reverse transcriptase domain-containing protein n=1 Tax=Steinernema glaseri TaxID=37863 RepID=A0A1I7ZYR6_9BILA
MSCCGSALVILHNHTPRGARISHPACSRRQDVKRRSMQERMTMFFLAYPHAGWFFVRLTLSSKWNVENYPKGFISTSEEMQFQNFLSPLPFERADLIFTSNLGEKTLSGDPCKTGYQCQDRGSDSSGGPLFLALLVN